MRKVFNAMALLAVVLCSAGCGEGKQEGRSLMTDSQKLRTVKMICDISSAAHDEPEDTNCSPEQDSPAQKSCKVKINEICEMFAGDILTPEEVAHWDSMNASGGCLLIRGAERDLDTVVNHTHIIFITEE